MQHGGRRGLSAYCWLSNGLHWGHVGRMQGQEGLVQLEEWKKVLKKERRHFAHHSGHFNIQKQTIIMQRKGKQNSETALSHIQPMWQCPGLGLSLAESLGTCRPSPTRKVNQKHA